LLRGCLGGIRGLIGDVQGVLFFQKWLRVS